MSKFKVGDRVRCIYGGFNYIGKDSIYVVTNNDSDGIYFTNDEGITEQYYDNEHFELVEGTKFNIGDRVRWIDESQPNCTAIGTVVKVNDDLVSVEFDNEIVSGWDCDGLAKDGYGWNIRKKYLELVSPKNELIDTDMDTEDIKNFPNAVLVAAEKEAKKQLGEEQEKVAVVEFKRLFGMIADKEREVKRVQKELADLRGKAAVVKKKK